MGEAACTFPCNLLRCFSAHACKYIYMNFSTCAWVYAQVFILYPDRTRVYVCAT